MNQEPGSNPKGPAQHKGLFWKSVVVVLLAAIGYNIYSGVAMKKVEVPGLFSIEFGDPPHTASRTGDNANIRSPETSGQTETRKIVRVDDPKLSEQQAELQARVRELEARIASQKQASTNTAPANEINLSGLWDSDQGMQYLIEQDGDDIALQEINPLLGITAEGEGTLDGRKIRLTYITALGTNGKARLSVEDDGDSISGTFNDLTTGVTMSIELYR